MLDSPTPHLQKIINIKGLSWMLKSSATSSACSTTPSHIDQQFKVFKLKDQKKKWKKKINKKFQSVGEQIEATIQHKYDYKQPFDLNFKKFPDLKHTPHLKHSESLIFPTPLKINQSRTSKTSQKSRWSQKSFLKTISGKQNSLHQKTASVKLPTDSYQYERKVIDLRKAFGEIKNENSKVKQSKNIMRIHSQQKQLLDKNNQQFLRRQNQWVDDKVEFYNQFDIKDYERKLIQKKCQEED